MEHNDLRPSNSGETVHLDRLVYCIYEPSKIARAGSFAYSTYFGSNLTWHKLCQGQPLINICRDRTPSGSCQGPGSAVLWFRNRFGRVNLIQMYMAVT